MTTNDPRDWGQYSDRSQRDRTDHEGYGYSGSLAFPVLTSACGDSSWRRNLRVDEQAGLVVPYRPIEIEPDIDSLVDKLWKKMFDQPAIIPCAHCQSHNAYTNSNCVSCGAPMGKSANVLQPKSNVG